METIFLACFAFGLLFTLASVALGAVGGGMGHSGVHLGHGGGHAVPHISHGVAHAGHGPGHVAHDAHIPHQGPRGSSLPLLNASSAVGALTWFGAAGYVLLRLGD